MSGNNSRKHKRYMLMLQRAKDHKSIETGSAQGCSDRAAKYAAREAHVTETPGGGCPYENKGNKQDR